MDTMSDTERQAVWVAMADQFLDTETRTWIPRAALTIVEAGYSRQEARRIWRWEVSPAVFLNVWSVAGEWAGWDEGWLFERCERLRGGRPSLGWLSYLGYRLGVHCVHSSWVAIERCMALLEPLPPEGRQGLCADLTYLTELFFDFGAGEPMQLSGEKRAALRALYEDIFLPIFASLVVHLPVRGETAAACRGRVARALG